MLYLLHAPADGGGTDGFRVGQATIHSKLSELSEV